MTVYSPFFHTLYDQPAPVGDLGRGTHYSVFRAVHSNPCIFQDFAVIWDEDHDNRIVWILEQLFAYGLLRPVLFVGERKAGVTLIVEKGLVVDFETYAHCIETQVNAPNDEFNFEIQTTQNLDSCIINDHDDRVRKYLEGINALWVLGLKEAKFTWNDYTERLHEKTPRPWKGIRDALRDPIPRI